MFTPVYHVLCGNDTNTNLGSWYQELTALLDTINAKTTYYFDKSALLFKSKNTKDYTMEINDAISICTNLIFYSMSSSTSSRGHCSFLKDVAELRITRMLQKS